MSLAVGQSVVRVDGRQKVTGTATYAAEFRLDGLVHAVLVQSTISKGRIEAIETAEALRAPGVLEILTHENAPKLHPLGDHHPGMGDDRLPLADDVIHHAGQHVAVVVAETLEQAHHAASLVRVRTKEEKPALELSEGEAYYPRLSFGRPLQHERGDVAGTLAAADLVKIEETYTTPAESHNPMEPSATVAVWDGGRLTVYDSTQAVVGTRDILAATLGLSKKKVRIVCPFVGGGFGCKGFQWPHTILAAQAAQVIKRPVKLVLTRAQMFTATGHRPATVQRLTLAARKDGALAAMRHETVQPTSTTTEYVEACGLATTAMLYACENVAVPHQVVRLNIPTPTPMRAPGECPGTFALESALDELAYALGTDPVELRVRNHADRDPSDGKPWSSKHLLECYERGAAAFGWSKRTPQPGSMKDGGLLVGWGMATAVYPGFRWPASARIRLTADGRALVRAATQDLGTGAYTVFTQVAADALGLPIDQVSFELGDSDFPPAPVSGGSNSTASVSEAILRAAAALKKKLEGGWAGRDSVEAEAFSGSDDPRLDAHSISSFGAHFCAVAIDPLLPRVQVTRWVSAIDGGKILNPRLGRSQILGGVTMGIGMALLEHAVHDPRTGRPVTDNLADYAVPVNADVPEIEVVLLDHPDPVLTTLGCRGIGEIGVTGVAAAIANAVHHATGRRVRDLPITPDKLLWSRPVM